MLSFFRQDALRTCLTGSADPGCGSAGLFRVIATLEGGMVLSAREAIKITKCSTRPLRASVALPGCNSEAQIYCETRAVCVPQRTNKDTGYGSKIEVGRRSGNGVAQPLGAKQIASQDRERTDRRFSGGTMSDVMMMQFLAKAARLGGRFIFGCFATRQRCAKAFDLIVTRVKERLAKIRLEDLEPKGSG